MGKIRQYCDISASGGKIYPFINAIRQSDMICTHQHCKGDVFLCRIRMSELAKLRQIADSHGVAITASPRSSLTSWLRRYRLRFGIPIGLLCCIGLMFYLSNIVVTIEIRGNTAVSDSVILSVLENGGLSQGAWIGSIDMTRCERRLRTNVPEIAWAGIRSSGNRIVVEIAEATPKIPMLDERTPSNIVSMYDAQITDVRVYSGHLVHLIGDGVAAGEMIVSGVYEDEKGHVTYHHANASITGIYQKEAELSEYFVHSETSDTEDFHVRRFLRLFTAEIPLNSGNHGFSEYRENVVYTPFSFLGQTLPFGIVQQTFSETQTEILTRSEEDTLLALNTAIVRYEKNFLQDVSILDREIVYSSDENGMTCHIIYTLEGEIGTGSDIYVK
ncbi:MAG: sporulation protein YqfD [Oscillospiraceae bacterium]|nr:sporulation protein YqfD [Oscillospiraceae bacterium]